MNYALSAIVTITVKRTDGTKLQMIMVWEGDIYLFPFFDFMKEFES